MLSDATLQKLLGYAEQLTRRHRLNAEKECLETDLKKFPEEAVLTRMSAQARIDDLDAQLRATPLYETEENFSMECKPETVAEIIRELLERRRRPELVISSEMMHPPKKGAAATVALSFPSPVIPAQPISPTTVRG